MKSPKKINLAEKFSLFSDHWSPKVLGELNDNLIKIAKFKDEFTWHSHENEDELFIVIKGELIIKFRDSDLTAKEGEMILVPKGVEHCPYAKEEVWAMLIEPKTVLNTGDVENDKTVKNLKEI